MPCSKLRTVMQCLIAVLAFLCPNVGDAAEELRNSSERTEPFLYGGGPIERLDDDHWRGRLYRKAIARFPDTLSCLDEAAALKGDRSRLPIDWAALGEREERDVCVFRIGSSIKNVTVFRDWLTKEGYRVTDLHRSGKRTVRLNSELELVDVCLFSAFLPLNIFLKRVDVGFFQSAIWYFWGVQRIFIGINMTCSGDMISVGEIVNYE